MQTALVLGNAIATVKHASLNHLKLLVCQPVVGDSLERDGSPILVVDHLGCGSGDRVMITSDGGAVRDLLGLVNSPIRWTVLGLIDPPVEDA